MKDQITTALVINGADPSAYSRGEFNAAMADAAAAALAPHMTVLRSRVADNYDVQAEIEKYRAADLVIYQYPVFWFMVPGRLKQYMDDVFAYDAFFTYNDGPYGSGGLMHGRKVMFSTTWNAPAEAFDDRNAFFGGMNPAEAILPMRKAHQYCGFTELPHFSSHNVIKDPQFASHKARLESHLRKVLHLEKAVAAA
ncbi:MULTISPECIES: NAD(P)H-dependent oxidoreductase [Kordiimonas]|uniref:NAD(P)H-dependent oxidoreductase n=1 Tax=Kordiimonas TaxID=288021 RepID=UPI002579BFB5|nr:NAD(P)H-dependent oxidoreductase [Kordiimonas sp. UBA4487]